MWHKGGLSTNIQNSMSVWHKAGLRANIEDNMSIYGAYIIEAHYLTLQVEEKYS